MFKDNLDNIKQRIAAAEIKYQRKPGSVMLLAVSKTQPVEKIKTAYAAGQRGFGENYLQEALDKIQALKECDIEWHFIGAVQSNKTKKIAENFAWVHSVSRVKIARRLSEQRPDNLPPLNVCIEVNIDNEPTKSGVMVDELFELSQQITHLENIRLRGLMVIPTPTNNFEEQLQTFKKVLTEQQRLIDHGILLDTLSMGMTDDFEAAIAAGSTMVRIGTAIFGKREAK